MATFETKFGLGQVAWVVDWLRQRADKCKTCGHTEPKYADEVVKVKIVRVDLSLGTAGYRFRPGYKWCRTSGRSGSGYSLEEDIYATRAEALKALKRKQKKRK